MARPAARACRLQLRPPCKGAVGCSQVPCKGRAPAGPVARKRAIGYGRDASRKAACEQKHRPLPAASPQGQRLPVASSKRGGAHGVGHRGDCRRARAAAVCVGAAVAQKGNMGLGHPLEKRMILPI
ncbi:hypothetical protein GW17_00049623 [Ensete ventricosum]|nr:hypothetical protein GW17_00049623 [Ensete ventricosum]